MLYYFYFVFTGRNLGLNFFDYIFIVLCIIFRYLLIVLTLVFFPISALIFALEIVVYGKIDLGFSKKYSDESKLYYSLYLLFFKIPFASSKFLIYALLRIFSKSKNKHKFKINFRSFFLNFVFVNVFGSPRWLFEFSLSLSRDFKDSLNRDISSKKIYMRLFIRYRICMSAINSRLKSDCNYFISKCNESKIIKTNNGLIFNMFKFSFEKGIIIRNGTKILAAKTTSTNGKVKYHPLHDNEYKEGSSDGSVYSHFPMKDQKFLALRDNSDDNWHFAIYNNIQAEKAIDRNKMMKLEQSDILTNTERKIVKVLRVMSGDKIFYQEEGKFGLTNYSFRDLNKEQAKILGLSGEKYNEILKEQNELTFNSQSDEDLFINALNNALNDRIDHRLSSSCKYVFDRKNISNLEKLKGLNGREIIFKLNYNKLMWQEYTLVDKHILECVDTNNNDLDEN